MPGVETIARIGFEHFQNRQGIQQIARELGIARDTVRKVLRSDATAFNDKRTTRPQPKLGPWVETLTAILEVETKAPKRERRSTQRLSRRCEGEDVVADHPRSFKREQVIYDPWHYLPVLLRKLGALRNGAPFKDWELPPALAKVRVKLRSHADGDRQFIKILAAVPAHGVTAVEDACAEALWAGIALRAALRKGSALRGRATANAGVWGLRFEAKGGTELRAN
jgi:hypothetical protein